MATIPLSDIDQRRIQSPRPPMLQQPGHIRVSLGDVAKNFAAPLLSPDLADNSGMMAVANAGKHVAGIFQDVAERQFEAINLRKVAEADSAMDQAQGEFEAWKLKNPDETTWHDGWQQIASGTKEKLFAGNLSPVARDAIQNRFTRWQGQGAIRVNVDSAKTSFRKAGDVMEERATRLADVGDLEGSKSIRTMMVQQGRLGADEAVRREFADRDRWAGKQMSEVLNELNTSADNGDTSQFAGLGEKAKTIHGYNEAEWQRNVQIATKKAEYAKAVQVNKTDNEMMDKIAWERANGAVYTPQAIKDMREAGLLSDGAAAHITTSVQQQVGADPVKFEQLMTKVMGYNETSDIASGLKESQDLKREMIALNLSPDQVERFRDGMAIYGKLNTKPEGVNETSTKTAARKAIEAAGRAMLEDTKGDRTENIFEALQDRNKLFNFGITDSTVIEKLASMDPAKRVTGPAALEIFKEAARNIERTKDGKVATTRDAGKYALLSDYTKKLFADALTGKLIDKQAAPSAIIKSEFDEAKTMQDFEAWWQTVKNDPARKGKPPTIEEANSWIQTRTDGALKGGVIDFFKPPPKAAPKQDAKPLGKVTSFAYPDDETPDRNSAAGIGAFTIKGDPETKMKPNDFAASPDVEVMLRDSGIKPRERVRLILADNSTVEGRWMDRTMQDDDAMAKFGKPLRGRFDLYSPTARHGKEGLKIVGFEKI